MSKSDVKNFFDDRVNVGCKWAIPIFPRRVSVFGWSVEENIGREEVR
jgi:hypothetical protein